MPTFLNMIKIFWLFAYLVCAIIRYWIRTGVAKLRPAGRMRPSEDFLRPPVCLIVNALPSLLNMHLVKTP